MKTAPFTLYNVCVIFNILVIRKTFMVIRDGNIFTYFPVPCMNFKHQTTHKSTLFIKMKNQ